MPRRATWIVVAALLVLLAFASADVLRSSGDGPGTAAPKGSKTRTQGETGPFRRCTRLDIRVSIEILGGVATAVVRNIGLTACHLRRLPVELSIEGGAGNSVPLEGFPAPPPVGGNFPPAFEQTTNFPEQIPDCRFRGPFVVSATVGPYSARREVTGPEIGCFRS